MKGTDKMQPDPENDGFQINNKGEYTMYDYSDRITRMFNENQEEIGKYIKVYLFKNGDFLYSNDEDSYICDKDYEAYWVKNGKKIQILQFDGFSFGATITNMDRSISVLRRNGDLVIDKADKVRVSFVKGSFDIKKDCDNYEYQGHRFGQERLEKLFKKGDGDKWDEISFRKDCKLPTQFSKKNISDFPLK